MAVTKPSPAAGITLSGPQTNQPGGGGVTLFRVATDRHTEIGSQNTTVHTAAQQNVTTVLEGTGFLESVDFMVQCVTAANAAAVAYQPDAPWSAIQNLAFKAMGPDLINMTGYSWYLWNLYGGFGLRNPATSTDTGIYLLTAGGGGTGGSFTYTLRVPLAINDRNMIGILGNQDAATKYQLTTDVAPNASVYTVLPTAAGTITLNRILNFCTVPAPTDARGQQQQQVPPAYGVLHMANELRSEANPVSASTVNHFLRSLGNTDRLFILVFRDSTGARVDAMLPTRISFRVGADVVYSEPSAHRRFIMRKRYNFDAPPGVLVYDRIQDFTADAGFELGDDWFNSEGVPNAQIEATYPVFANSPGSLTIITDQIVVPPGMDIKPYV